MTKIKPAVVLLAALLTLLLALALALALSSGGVSGEGITFIRRTTHGSL